MLSIRALLEVLHEEHVAFVVVGGVAAITHGMNYVTFGLDICYERSAENLSRLVQALDGLAPQLRIADDLPPLPFFWDVKTLQNGLNFTLVTDYGPIDLLADLPGVGMYSDVAAVSVEATLFGRATQILSLDGLIQAKQAANRPKDQQHLVALRAIRAKRN